MTFGRDKLAAINPVGHETYEGVNQETIELKLSGVCPPRCRCPLV